MRRITTAIAIPNRRPRSGGVIAVIGAADIAATGAPREAS